MTDLGEQMGEGPAFVFFYGGGGGDQYTIFFFKELGGTRAPLPSVSNRRMRDICS
jgi:hypothetical protein